MDMVAEEVMGAEESKDEPAEPPINIGRLPLYVTENVSTDLSEKDINSYYQILEPQEGWPKGLESEFKVSQTNYVMYRSCTHELFNRIEASFNVLKEAILEAEKGGTSPTVERQAHFLLQGSRGCGKSVALASVVEFSRLCGAVVLYIPSCLSLVNGGMYHKHEETGMWDTPDHARSLLSALLEAHGNRLVDAPGPDGQGNLRDLAEDGLTREGNAMEAALTMIECLRTTTAFPVMVALDDYNALYSHTGYYEAVTFKKRRMIKPGELRLASALRMLEHEPITNGVCIAAPTYSSALSPKLQIPYQKGSMFQVPVLNEVELEQMAQFYSDYDAITEKPDGTLLLRLGAISCGSGEEFRRYITLT